MEISVASCVCYCVDVFCGVHLFCVKNSIMADVSVFSLEEDDGADLFITQTPSGIKAESVIGEKEDNLFEFSGVTQFGIGAGDL